MPGRPARKADSCRPQGVIRRRYQHFVTTVEQRVHRHDDQLGHAIADVNILDTHPLDVFLLGVVHHRLACRENPLGIGVTGGIGQIADDVLLDFLGGIKTESRQIADVQLDDLVAFFLHLPCARGHRPANVVTDIGQFG